MEKIVMEKSRKQNVVQTQCRAANSIVRLLEVDLCINKM